MTNWALASKHMLCLTTNYFFLLLRDINRVVWGVDLVEEHLLASCGLPAKPLIARRPLVRLAEYSINAPVTGECAMH